MSRRKGRVLAFQGLYSWDVGGARLDDVLTLSWAENEKTAEPVDEDSGAFARFLIAGTAEHKEEIDRLITAHLNGWEFGRVNKVSIAVLRMSVYALLYQKDIPPTIIIDEAIDIAKEYGQDDAFKFVNAVLDAIRKDLEKQA
ncbi:MAG: transcription antitermination factor NusB [Treponema sp.]|nr:transcription antitermination factor NusB [Treponema sp.]